jgi:hypothetical protein
MPRGRRRKVIEVKLIDDIALAQQSDHWVVLMAGGLGSRRSRSR